MDRNHYPYRHRGHCNDWTEAMSTGWIFLIGIVIGALIGILSIAVGNYTFKTYMMTRRDK